MANKNRRPRSSRDGRFEISKPIVGAGPVPVVLNDPRGIAKRQAPERLPMVDTGIAETRQNEKVEIGCGVAHGLDCFQVKLEPEGRGRGRHSCAEYPPENRVDVLEVMVEVEVGLEFLVRKLCP